ncbi:cytochrome P450 [Nocardia sp. CDC159]|uniref:Cytochrome P450 n=1 Tax=Nocardia pulmonis TaxID=2951408 RepID=A0A9X2EIJ6_9NOCA|nr:MULTISPECIES: cytochrome P450 [Nocardia]MCM6778888.1 cytochrome P450 [Nocardia pulmonis]MCM6791777.1 cytochrome P450 [Nocardia sp. CDC159]
MLDDIGARELAVPEMFTPEFFRNPYPYYAWLRDNRPVHPVPVPFVNIRVWLVSRYADVRAGFADPRLSSDYRSARPEFRAAGLAFGAGTVGERTMVNLDPPDHTRIRSLAAGTFTAARIAQWEAAIRATVAELLDALPVDEPVDMLARVAAPLSVRVICAILGAHRRDEADLRRWGDLVFTADPTELAQVPAATASLLGYAEELVARKREHPGDDLLSALITASDDTGVLSSDELIGTSVGLVVAGYETTIRLIGAMLLALLDHPAQLAALRDGRHTTADAVEEALRYDGPQASSLWRFATEDLEISGTTIPTSEPVLLLVGSAHRDERHYPNPDVFDIGRADKRHLAFGHGIHHCLGAALARLVSRVLLESLLARYSQLSLAAPRDEIRYKPSLVVRGPDELPLVLHR